MPNKTIHDVDFSALELIQLTAMLRTLALDRTHGKAATFGAMYGTPVYEDIMEVFERLLDEFIPVPKKPERPVNPFIEFISGVLGGR